MLRITLVDFSYNLITVNCSLNGEEKNTISCNVKLR